MNELHDLKEQELKIVSKLLAERYLLKSNKYNLDYISLICEDIINNYIDWPTNKLSHLIGYIQGVLVSKEIVTVREESDFTRELFPKNTSLDLNIKKSEVINITESIFEEKSKNGLSILYFWAPWCGPCRIQDPILKKLSNKIIDTNILRINTEKNKNLSNTFEIKCIPALIFYKDGLILEKLEGTCSENEIQDLLKKYK